MSPRLTESDKKTIWRHMRVPVFATVALLSCWASIVALGQLMPGRLAAFLEVGLTGCMILTVLLFTMEVREEKPLMRFYAMLGFSWLTILIMMTMLDYLTRP